MPTIQSDDAEIYYEVSGEGPAMYWYGWVVTALIGSSILGAIAATGLPSHVTRKIPLFLVWIAPLIAIPILAYALMPFWTR